MMRRRWKEILLSFLAGTAGIAGAQECFDFSKKVTQPLKNPTFLSLPLNDAPDASHGGGFSDHTQWGAARGVIQKPINQVVQKILDPMTIKGSDNGIEVSSLSRQNYFAFRQVKMTVHPFLFVSLRWEEDWAYTLLEGSEATPKSVLVSYQKTKGTDYIERFCGSIVIRYLDDKRTDVFLYEEIKAPRRSSEDTVRGHLGTLSSLRR